MSGLTNEIPQSVLTDRTGELLDAKLDGGVVGVTPDKTIPTVQESPAWPQTQTGGFGGGERQYIREPKGLLWQLPFPRLHFQDEDSSHVVVVAASPI